MTNLHIHIETSVHCGECREIIEFFLNGTHANFIYVHEVFGIADFMTKASQFFVQQGWRQQDHQTWLCAECHKSKIQIPNSKIEKRAA